MINLVRFNVPYDLHLAFYKSLSLKRFFYELKDPIPAIEKSGVYRLFFVDCMGVNWGDGRAIWGSLKEQMDAWHGSSAGTSTFADHLMESSYRFDPDRYFIIVCPFYNDEALGCNNFRWIDLEGTQWQKYHN